MTEILPGAEPWSAEGGPTGVLVLHGFTGNPSSMRGLAEAMAAAGHSVELPRLPGHGTTVDDMLTTSWADWARRLRDRARSPPPSGSLPVQVPGPSGRHPLRTVPDPRAP